jgi:saccharopine dehydrogenase-like NADP-dependent oxidoreductase
MNNVLVLGAGKIGRTVAYLLNWNDRFNVVVADIDSKALKNLIVSSKVSDLSKVSEIDSLLEGQDAVISCLPSTMNYVVAQRAKRHEVHYLDLSEDKYSTQSIRRIAEGAKTAFIPQCGLAPGFISIVGKHLIEPMSVVDSLRLRVGALPLYPTNSLKYNITWSVNGLINEYTKPCDAVQNGKIVGLPALDGLESLTIDGTEYEAFNTSGGLGTLAELLCGKVQNLDYKSIRYPGHSFLMKFLLHDLGLAPTYLEGLFESVIPTTKQDKVVIFAAAKGFIGDTLTEVAYSKTIVHENLHSAVQITTACSVCAVLELLLRGAIMSEGFVSHDQIPYSLFITTVFGHIFK